MSLTDVGVDVGVLIGVDVGVLVGVEVGESVIGVGGVGVGGVGVGGSGEPVGVWKQLSCCRIQIP